MGHHTYTRDALWSMALLGQGGNFYFLFFIFFKSFEVLYFYFIYL